MTPASEVVRPYLENDVQRASGKLPLVVMIQNGVDIEEEMDNSLVLAKEPLASGIVSGLAWLGTTLLDNGARIEHGQFVRSRLTRNGLRSASIPCLDMSRLTPQLSAC